MIDQSAKQKEMLIEYLKDIGYLRTESVISAFTSVKREMFMPIRSREFAYADEPFPIGSGQTISAPHMVAIMTELLEPRNTDKVLEIGSGSGYQAAVLALAVSRVITLEIDQNLCRYAEENLKRAGIRNVKVVCQDGSSGYPQEAPYDKIIVTCACPAIPEALVGQLKENGIMAIPLETPSGQELFRIRKSAKGIEKQGFGRVVFVPLRKS